MRYEEMINGLAEEMLEKVANEIEEEQYEEAYEGYEDEEGYEGYDEEYEVDDEQLESLAEEMYMEELQKIAEEEYGYEEELEKEAGINLERGKAMFNAAKGAAKKVGNKMAPKGFREAKANKEMAEAALGTALDPHNPALKKYKKEKAKLVAGAGAGLGVTGAGIAYGRKKVQEKAASYFEEAEFLKQAAEEAYQEAVMMQDAAIVLYNQMEE